MPCDCGVYPILIYTAISIIPLWNQNWEKKIGECIMEYGLQAIGDLYSHQCVNEWIRLKPAYRIWDFMATVPNTGIDSYHWSGNSRLARINNQSVIPSSNELWGNETSCGEYWCIHAHGDNTIAPVSNQLINQTKQWSIAQPSTSINMFT